MAKYVFKSYDPIFPQLFEEEKIRLIPFVGEVIIEHVGSTAIPGLGGKGIIDIAIAVEKAGMKEISLKAQQAGYEFKPLASNDDRLFHKQDLKDKKEGTRTYHLHIADKNSQEYKKMTAFRDYLRKHQKIRENMLKLKKKQQKKPMRMSHYVPLV